MSNVSADVPFVSVVVPFYNIEECVDYCLGSLLAQDYDSYEIVCVDDGSRDSTGKRLDAYKADPRVRVLHKENGGLSDARNYGVHNAKGRYITFVDGDDVVSPYYISSLVKGLPESGDAMVVGKTRRIAFGLAQQGAGSGWKKPKAVKEIEKRILVGMMMREDVLPGAWSRLAPRRVYEHVAFPEACYYEEIRTACEFISQVDKCYLVDTPIYGYVMRDGSIVHRKTAKYQQAEDYLTAIDAFSANAQQFFSAESGEMVFFRSLHLSRLFRLLNVVDDNNMMADKLKDQIRIEISNAYRQLMSDSLISKGNKIRFTLLNFFPYLYERVFSAYDRLIKEV